MRRLFNWYDRQEAWLQLYIDFFVVVGFLFLVHFTILGV